MAVAAAGAPPAAEITARRGGPSDGARPPTGAPPLALRPAGSVIEARLPSAARRERRGGPRRPRACGTGAARGLRFVRPLDAAAAARGDPLLAEPGLRARRAGHNSSHELRPHPRPRRPRGRAHLTCRIRSTRPARRWALTELVTAHELTGQRASACRPRAAPLRPDRTPRSRTLSPQWLPAAPRAVATGAAGVARARRRARRRPRSTAAASQARARGGLRPVRPARHAGLPHGARRTAPAGAREVSFAAAGRRAGPPAHVPAGPGTLRRVALAAGARAPRARARARLAVDSGAWTVPAAACRPRRCARGFAGRRVCVPLGPGGVGGVGRCRPGARDTRRPLTCPERTRARRWAGASAGRGASASG